MKPTFYRKLRHRNCVLLYGIYNEGPKMFLITEFLSLGALDDFLLGCRNSKRLTTTSMKSLMIHVTRGMAFLLSKDILHLDLAARNILLTNNDQVDDGELLAKVSDFGLSRISSDKIYDSKQKKPGNFSSLHTHTSNKVRWSSPELLEKGKLSKDADVWSFGVLCWEILTLGEIPYSDIYSNTEVILFVCKGQRLKKPTECPTQLWDVIASCFEECGKRPTFQQLHQGLESFQTEQPLNIIYS